MISPHFIKFSCMLLFVFLFNHGSKARSINTVDDKQALISKTITVDQKGQGDFKTIQQAIDSIPSDNKLWTLIAVKAGVYKEKVNVPQDKPFVVLKGESSRNTIVQWGETNELNATLVVHGENFVAVKIAFRNTYNLDGSKIPVYPAHAGVLTSDKASFYECSFVGVQDTLADMKGRHYFESCSFYGATDFIWSNAQSFYQKCVINATVSALGHGRGGVITAQGRTMANETTGFVFNECTIVGDGPVGLGRAYRNHSRVIFKNTYMSDIVQPRGWDAWDKPVESITFSEINCKGPGANKSKRVKWEKKLTPKEVQELTHVNTFINQEGWLEKQPKF